MNHRTVARTPWTEQFDHRSPDAGAAHEGQRLPRLDELTLTELVLPEQTNHYGTLFAPNGLALLGKAAFLVATRFTRQSVVMAAANRIEFRQPVPVGALLRVTAHITRIGRSSLTASVGACLDAAPGTRAPEVLGGDFEMVAVDERGRPCPITPAQQPTDAPLAPAVPARPEDPR